MRCAGFRAVAPRLGRLAPGVITRTASRRSRGFPFPTLPPSRSPALICVNTVQAYDGSASAAGHDSVFHSFERRNDFTQWKNACSTSTPMASLGHAFRGQALSSAGSRVIACAAVDAERVVTPRHHKQQADLRIRQQVLHPVESFVAVALGNDDMRLDRGRGRNPGPSPFGETSQVPSAPAVDIRRNGDNAMNGATGRRGRAVP